MAKKSQDKGKSRGKGKKEEPGWFGPLVLGIAIVVVVTLLAMRMCSGPSKEEKEAEEAARPAPTLVAYPEPSESFPKRRLRYASPDEAETLFVENCEWFLRWQLDEPAATIELLVFDRRNSAEKAWGREPGELVTGEVGEYEKIAPEVPRIALRRGHLVARIIGGEGATVEDLEPVVNELDAAIIRTWGAHPQ